MQMVLLGVVVIVCFTGVGVGGDGGDDGAVWCSLLSFGVTLNTRGALYEELP